jgi:general transcription factor IIIA
MQRHVQEIHEDSFQCGSKKEFICPEGEDDCGKTLKYASKLQKHEESHGEKLTSSKLSTAFLTVLRIA